MLEFAAIMPNKNHTRFIYSATNQYMVNIKPQTSVQIADTRAWSGGVDQAEDHEGTLEPGTGCVATMVRIREWYSVETGLAWTIECRDEGKGQHNMDEGEKKSEEKSLYLRCILSTAQDSNNLY